MLAGEKAASASPCERGFRVSRNARLRCRAEFQRVYKHGIRAGGRYLVVFALPRDEADAVGLRLGVTASKRVGNAVERNRCKRRLRELFRTRTGSCGGLDVDVVINARRGLAVAPWPELEREYRHAVTQLRDRLSSC